MSHHIRRSLSDQPYRRIKRCKCDQEISDCESSGSNKMDQYPDEIKHVFQRRHLKEFLTLMDHCLETDRYNELLDWEELRNALRLKGSDMHYTSHCLKKEYDRQFDLYILFLLLSQKHGFRYDEATKHLTYSDEIYAEMSYNEPKIRDIEHEILEPFIFSCWASVFSPRTKLSASADYDEAQIGTTCVMRWNPLNGYMGQSSRSSGSSYKYRRLNLTSEVDSNDNPTTLIVARLKRLNVPIDAIFKAVEKNTSLGIGHSAFLDQDDDSLLRWVATCVLVPDDGLSPYLQSWKQVTLLNIQSVPST